MSLEEGVLPNGKTKTHNPEQRFGFKRMTKEDIKRFLAIYFEASYARELIPDIEGVQFLPIEYDGAIDK